MRLRKWKTEWLVVTRNGGMLYWSDVVSYHLTEKGATRHGSGVLALDPNFVAAYRVTRVGS